MRAEAEAGVVSVSAVIGRPGGGPRLLKMPTSSSGPSRKVPRPHRLGENAKRLVREKNDWGHRSEMLKRVV